MADTFPRQQARTRRFTLGAPRTFTVSPDGRRVVFLRSAAPDDPLMAMWALDLESGGERLVADPADLERAAPFPTAAGEEPPDERARRERSREMAAGIVSYSTDRSLSQACFAVAGRLWLADLDAGGCRPLAAQEPVFDPRLDPAGGAIAYCAGRQLRLLDLGPGGGDHPLAADDDPAVSWGRAEFVAAEEMGRSRGHWWAPDGTSLLAARVDESQVPTWWIADPAHPERPPAAHRYPVAGGPDAAVTLHRVAAEGGSSPVVWDGAEFPYLVDVSWTPAGPPLLLVEARDHRRSRVLRVDASDTAVVAESSERAWVERIPGVPAWLAGGRLVWCEISEGTYRLVVDGDAVTPPGLQLRSVVAVGDDVTFVASPDPTVAELWRWSPAGVERLTSGGTAAGAAGGRTVVVAAHTMDGPPRYYAIEGSGRQVGIAAHLAQPLVTPAVSMLEVGARRLRVGVLLPTGHPAGRRLPVIMSPYGGPGAQRVVSARSAWLESQWLADRGFAVVVADGRGTPGRGPEWERAVAGDLATAALDDQVEALAGAAEAFPELDASAGVGIRGWSFGGYLAALAVLRRPDVFSVAVAGAPVTDWALYDTYYTERFLGHPATAPDAYRRSSLIGDAHRLTRPLMLIHGMVDDNVMVAHTLRLSQAFTEAGRPHTVLPLSGVTHLASQEEVAENLLELQVEFLSRHLPGPPG